MPFIENSGGGSGGGGGAPSGPAGGDLSGTYPNPAVKGLTETSGPTDLTLGAVANGELFKRVGATIVGTAAGAGTVTSVTATDGSVVVAGTAADPTVATGTLDAIATAHPPAANVAMNAKKITGLGAATAATDAASLANTLDLFGAPAANVAFNAKKITGLANGTAASDAAAFGQIGMVQLFDSTLGASAASFDITSISGSYSNLFLSYVLRNDGVVTISNVNLRLNNDSAGNYDMQRGVANNTAAGAGVSSAQSSFVQMGYATGASADAGSFGSGFMFLPNYAAGSTANRSALCLSVEISTVSTVANYAAKFQGGVWRSTAAITRLTLLPNDGSNWVAGSRVTLYGLI